jgi:hypothetical protein
MDSETLSFNDLNFATNKESAPKGHRSRVSNQLQVIHREEFSRMANTENAGSNKNDVRNPRYARWYGLLLLPFTITSMKSRDVSEGESCRLAGIGWVSFDA